MTLFAVTLQQATREEALLILEVILWLFLPLSFLRVAGYTANRFSRGHLINGKSSPLPMTANPSSGWLFVLSVLCLLFLHSWLSYIVVPMCVSIFLLENQRTANEQFGLDKLSLLDLLKWSLFICGTVIFVEIPLTKLVDIILTAVNLPHPDQETVAIFRNYNKISEILVFLLSAVILAPMIEELFFRGFLFTFLKNYTSTWLALILSAGVFAFVHANLGSAIPLWFLGIALGLAYEHTGSLLLPMGIHACFNFYAALSILLEKGSS